MSLDSTIRYVQMATRYAPPSARTRVPTGRPSLTPEVEYARKLVGWVGELATGLRMLPRLLAEQRHHGIRVDESPLGRRVRAVTEPLRRQAGRAMVHLEPDMRYAARAASSAHADILARQTRAALGVEVPTLDTAIPSAIDRFVSKNLTRIRSIDDKLIGEVEAIMLDAWDDGLSEAEVAALIEKRIGVAETYARFLARDQMAALYAQITRARHDELGVRLFRWWTQGDSHVRESHAVKHRRVFPYDGSRAPSFFPVDEYGCRCWEEPVFDEIAQALYADKGRTRAA